MWCPQAEDSLEEFLKQKSVESSAILQADKQLTEKEKKMMGESLQHKTISPSRGENQFIKEMLPSLR